MKRIIKFTKAEAANIVFISDLHYNHDKDFLWKPRGFETMVDHCGWIISQWNEHIDENTIVVNLGDVCFHDQDGALFDMISKLPCKEHYVVWGNHNSGSTQCYHKAVRGYINDHTTPSHELPEIYPLRYNNVTFCGNDLTLKIGKQLVFCSHFPKRIWDKIGWKAWALSGHSHGSDSGRLVNHTNGKSLDVGIENAIEFDNKFHFTFEDITNIMSHKNVAVLDHHDSQTSYG